MENVCNRYRNEEVCNNPHISPIEEAYDTQELLEDFAFPASRVEAQLRGGAGDGGGTAAVAVCPGPDALRAALDLLVALCTQCPENLATCAALLSDMFYADQPPLQEWEYLPPVGPRPRGGFVGLQERWSDLLYELGAAAE
ncbi:hypothetical protein HPB50_004977 [Hyalomma asiaticum]|uniref:Uncharacterized protein n=1 Tax=Hyalomma asiaticum TaxID=266040 RepID=A0ACB7STF7_HYAAI|nr:hypothetical protein HPB50_004977 [Hyalomma asiaticum]